MKGKNSFLNKSAVLAIIHAVLLCFVSKFSDRGLQNLGGHGDLAAGVFEGIDDHFFLQAGDGVFQRQGGHGVGFFSGLKGRRQMITVNNAFLAQQHRPFDAVFQFSDVSRPVVFHEHVNGRRGKAFNVL